MSNNATIFACDVGGTSIKLAVVRGSALLSRDEIDARAGEGLEPALKVIARTARVLCRMAGIKRDELCGFGLSFPGIIEPGSERILSTPAGKFDDAKRLNVQRLIKRLLGLRTVICNDANAALAGEWNYGAARGCRSAVMMTLGTGIGASAIIDGVPLRGQHGQAGCLGGHLMVNLRGRVCLCGNLGCAESEASTWVLPVVARACPDFAESRLAREKRLDYAALFRLAMQRDGLAMELRDRSIRVWSGALVSLIHAYDPEVAVIGGGIMRNGKIILPAMRRYVRRHAWTPWGEVKIKPAALGNDAGLLGIASFFDTST